MIEFILAPADRPNLGVLVILPTACAVIARLLIKSRSQSSGVAPAHLPIAADGSAAVEPSGVRPSLGGLPVRGGGHESWRRSRRGLGDRPPLARGRPLMRRQISFL